MDYKVSRFVKEIAKGLFHGGTIPRNLPQRVAKNCGVRKIQFSSTPRVSDQISHRVSEFKVSAQLDNAQVRIKICGIGDYASIAIGQIETGIGTALWAWCRSVADIRVWVVVVRVIKRVVCVGSHFECHALVKSKFFAKTDVDIREARPV